MNGPTFAPSSTAPAHRPLSARTDPGRPAARPSPAKPAEAADGAAVVRILTYVRLHWLMILFCGLFLGAGLAYTAWSVLPAKFESYALLQVASSPVNIAQSNDPTRSKGDFVTYLKTTAQLIKSEFVLNSALSDPKYKIADLPTLKAQVDPIKYLEEKLEINYSEGSEVIRITLAGDRGDDIRKIVDAVTDAYYREVVEKEVQQKASFKLKVEQARAALEGVMRTKVGLPEAPSHTVGLGGDPAVPAGPLTPLPVPMAAGGLPVAAPPAELVQEPKAANKVRFEATLKQILGLESDIKQMPIMIGEKGREVEGLKQQIDALRTGPASADSLEEAERDPDVVRLAAAAKANRDTAKFKALVVKNPDSYEVVRAKEYADAAEMMYKQARDDKARAIETARRQGEADKLFALLAAAQRDLANYKERERFSKVRLDEARKDLNNIPPELTKEEEKPPIVNLSDSEILIHDDIYRRLTAQLISVGFELDSPPRVRKLQPASVPTQADAKKQILGTAFAGLLGFALIGLGVVGYETAVRKVSSLGELTSAGPSTVVGVIPWQPGAGPAKDPVRRAEVNEAVDKLRSYVSQTWLSRGATTVAVTSPVGDEGKAFTAFGLASSLAQAGYRTLLVDFDLRNPALHLHAGVTNDVGACDLLRGDAEVRRAVQVLPSGLQFIPAGKWSDEARQAAVGGRLETLLARLREPYDCVVLHGHALLTAAESVEIARRCEVVLLCSQYRETRLPMLKRAADRVATMEIPYSGIVYVGATPSEAIC